MQTLSNGEVFEYLEVVPNILKTGVPSLQAYQIFLKSKPFIYFSALAPRIDLRLKIRPPEGVATVQ